MLLMAILIYVAADNMRRNVRGEGRRVLQRLPTDLLVEIALSKGLDRQIIENELGDRGLRILRQALTHWATNFQLGRSNARGLDNMIRVFEAELGAQRL